jgi:hypothetical protein
VDLLSLVETVSPVSGGAFAARQIPGYPLHFTGRDCDGFPVLLLGSRDVARSVTPPIRLMALQVQFAVPCEIALPNGRREKLQLSVVCCRSADPELQHYFLKVAESIVRLVGSSPATTQVTGALRRIVQLFQKLEHPPSRELLGLYGELLIIMWSHCAADAVSAWRNDSTARFDFSRDEIRIDVKTCGRRVRSHMFSLDQCRPPPGTVGIFASLLIEPGAGLALLDIVRAIEARIVEDADLTMKLHDLVADSLGGSLAEGLKARYDHRAARNSLQWYWASDIPSPQECMHPSVSEVRFRSELTAIEGRHPAEILANASGAEWILPHS